MNTLLCVLLSRYRYDLSVEEAAELARRAIYHATFRDGASGGVASGILLSRYLSLFVIHTHLCACANSPLLTHDLNVTDQFIMWDQMDGRSSLAMMWENFTTTTIQ